ncbi:MAG: hypothetical protein ACT6Q3_00365 [Sphingopyxis sp.]
MARRAADPAHQIACPVGRIVVDEEYFPAAPGQHDRQFFDQPFDIGGFIERRDDNRDLERLRIHGQNRVGGDRVVAHEISILPEKVARGWSRSALGKQGK